MDRSVRAYAALFRVFLAPTAVADSLAGFVLAWGVAAESGGDAGDVATIARAVGVAVCSVLSYSLGMALNDVFDVRKDRERNVEKPIVSGALSLRAAIAVSVALAVVAGGVAAALGVLPLWFGLVAAILAYNGGGKRLPLIGNALMGGCRGLNFLLGAATFAGVASVVAPSAFLGGAGILAAYVTLVTAVSLLEDRPYRPRGFALTVLPFALVPVLLIVLQPASVANVANAAILGFLLFEAFAGARRRDRSPVHPAAVFVRKSLAGIFFVDAGALLALSPHRTSNLTGASLIYVLFVIHWIWKRRWLRAGREGS